MSYEGYHAMCSVKPITYLLPILPVSYILTTSFSKANKF